MEIKLNDLKYIVFSGAGGDTPVEILNEVYSTWKNVWSKAFLELDGIDKIHSDGFTRQTKIGALFYKNTCVSLSAFREADFRAYHHREDSLLSAWDEEAFKKLLVDGPKVLICSYLSVHPDYRGEIAPGVSFKQLISHLSTRLLLDSDCDVMTGTTRNNRGTDKAAYATGATFIKKSSMHGVEVDLIGLFRRHIQANISQYQNFMAERLWSDRTDYTINSSNTVRKAG